ncbi:MAG: TetR/AcrR family transcriptional regulator [Roseofilum sp. SBFL]|uniref:TetR/AcrR family transcriptional regulator n=1 Tax=unclassified Roseofilum TaxID=2620099 RepID=UPI001B2233AC|nr:MULTISPECIES: TetR/AcrR family transcriptional regulator [unclassified Roseofilum]MBP0014502.1 TetR/AcrR family transcriptional regulator [Roseofilum sp. SID3]MBP0026556.1 TetR/AcrR family transcriptional regulator [Roseofilum sp. SID2]MBP0039458.1 TetR/AcrR family transcriptional regulator [Roseofilum sp. SID1]MBP0044163.1 TetR/AcrR family transcriptional regulator [Roseofilum sp. SBFL]
MPRTRDEKKFKEKCDRILEVAAQCFLESGFHGTGMAKICKAVGMSPGALYRYFPSKESIIEAIVEEEQAITATLLGELARAEDKAIALADLIAGIGTINTHRHDCQLWLEILAEAGRNQEIANLLQAIQAEALRAIETAICQGQVRGQIDTTLVPKITAQLLIAMIDGTMGQLVIEPCNDPDLFAKCTKQTVLKILTFNSVAL